MKFFLAGVLMVVVAFSAFAGPVKVAYLTVVLDHPYWRAQAVTIANLAWQQGVELTTFNAAGDAIKQASQVDAVILQKPDVVIFAAVDTGAGASLVAKMKEAGIPVVVNNRPIPGGNYDIQIVIDPVLMGQQSAQCFVDFAKARYGTPKGNFLELQGQLSDDNVIQWEKGFKSVMAKYPQMKWNVQNTNWDLVRATQEASDAFMANPNYDGVYMQSDALLPAMTPIIKDKPKSGSKGHIFWLSQSGDDYALSEIRAGHLDVAVNMPVDDMASLSLEYALKLANGEKIQIGPVVRAGAHWSPSQIKQGETGLDFYLSSWLVDKKTAGDPTLWGNKYKYK
jgi:ABC-type sugar transport system substrate-binding protein